MYLRVYIIKNSIVETTVIVLAFGLPPRFWFDPHLYYNADYYRRHVYMTATIDYDYYSDHDSHYSHLIIIIIFARCNVMTNMNNAIIVITNDVVAEPEATTRACEHARTL